MHIKDQIDTQLVLRIGIDGVWTPSNFSRYFEALNDLYLFMGPWKLFPSDWDVEDFHENIQCLQLKTLTLALYDPDLQVKKIRFESPGFSDLAGAGQVIGHLKDFLIALLHFSVNRRKAMAESDRCEAEAIKIRAEANRIQFEANRVTEEAMKLRAESKKIDAEAHKLRAEAELILVQREKLLHELFKGRLSKLEEGEYGHNQIGEIESALAIQAGRLADSMELGRIVSIETKNNA